MARRHHKARRFRGYVDVPGLGNVQKFLNSSVNAQDVLVGAGIGLLGSGVVKFASQYVPFQLPAMLAPFRPLLTGAVVGAAAYFVEKKSARAKGHAVGAVAAGATLTAWEFLKAAAPAYFGEAVSVNLNRYGVLVNENPPALQGLLINDNPRALSEGNLSQLAGAAMLGEEVEVDVPGY